MVIKSYNDVSPSKYEGLSDGVQIREMITAQDAPQPSRCASST